MKYVVWAGLSGNSSFFIGCRHSWKIAQVPIKSLLVREVKEVDLFEDCRKNYGVANQVIV
jgi:hypothetical protein